MPVLFFQTVYREMKKDLEQSRKLNSNAKKDKNVKPKQIEQIKEKEDAFERFLHAISCI